MKKNSKRKPPPHKDTSHLYSRGQRLLQPQTPWFLECLQYFLDFGGKEGNCMGDHIIVRYEFTIHTFIFSLFLCALFHNKIRMSEKWSEHVSLSVSNSLRPHGLQPTRLLCPWNFPRQNTGMGCNSLLQGIFLTQGPNQGLPHCGQILYHLSHQGGGDKDV